MDLSGSLTPAPSLELVKIIKGVPRNLTLKPGDYFGHEVMLDEQEYAATVVSLQSMTGWKITRRALAQTVPLDRLRRAVNSA
jgi:CRP-like cAMP-binding protein